MAIIPLASAPGIQRDGTMLAATAHTDGQWCRWQRGLPRKIGGYKVIEPYLTGIERLMYSQAASGYRYMSCGNAVGVDFFTVDNFAQASSVFNPTFPATTHPTTAGLPTGPNYLNVNSWQMETQYDNASNSNLLFLFANQNLLDPTNAANFPLYSTPVYTPGNPTQVAGYGTGSDGHGGTQQALFPNGISGGIVSLAPYMIVYGNNGFFAWSTPGYPTDFVGTTLGSLYVGATEITNQKILKGFPLRGGGGYSPAGLFWSVDSLVRATFIGVQNGTWQFDQLTTQSSLLSDRCIIEHDGTFYWAGVDRFLMFNGVVQEIPNSQSLNWFFDGINTQYAGKSFAMKVPRYGEIWWCYPRGTSTECSHAVIYNYREKYWYDTPLPNTGRSAGLHADNLVGNLMSGILPYQSSVSGSPATYYNLWEHETGYDEINGIYQNAINSYFTTAPITAFNSQPPSDATTSLQQLEPDIVQTGAMQLNVLKQNNANSPVYAGSSVTINPVPTGANTSSGASLSALNQIVPLKDTAKILRIQVQSNVLGGNYQMGKSMLTMQVDGKRST
jgi:hypothetical protein